MHRDLKPTNILVMEVDGKPSPKIIDFGIAKAVRDGIALDQTINPFTVIGGTIGTPGYMSPEQADPSVADIDTRTDVYSLGVVLYEMLTSSLPFASKAEGPALRDAHYQYAVGLAFLAARTRRSSNSTMP